MDGWLTLGGWFGAIIVTVAVTALVESGRLADIRAVLDNLRAAMTETGSDWYGETVTTETVEQHLTRIQSMLVPWWVRLGMIVRREGSVFVGNLERILPRPVWIFAAALLIFALGASVGAA